MFKNMWNTYTWWLIIVIAMYDLRTKDSCMKDSCTKKWCFQWVSDSLNKASHFTAFCAWDSSSHLPVTPAQLMRPNIAEMCLAQWTTLHDTCLFKGDCLCVVSDIFSYHRMVDILLPVELWILRRWRLFVINRELGKACNSVVVVSPVIALFSKMGRRGVLSNWDYIQSDSYRFLKTTQTDCSLSGT